jgi:hypothetical protein
MTVAAGIRAGPGIAAKTMTEPAIAWKQLELVGISCRLTACLDGGRLPGRLPRPHGESLRGRVRERIR